MKIALAAVGFYERDIEYNRNKILKCLKENSGKAENKIYSSQLTIGADGNILNLFRRVSKGWRESFAD